MQSRDDKHHVSPTTHHSNLAGPSHRRCPGPSMLTTSEAVLGLAPSGDPPSSLEQSGPASSSYSVRQSDSSPAMGSRVQVRSAGWCGTSAHTPPAPAQPQLQRLPQPLTIGTAIRDIGRGGLDPGHNLCQVSEARAGEGQYLRGSVGEAYVLGLRRGPEAGPLGVSHDTGASVGP